MTANKGKELLPCPFCGGDDSSITEINNAYEPGCQHCWVSIGQFTSRESAVRNWNRRPEASIEQEHHIASVGKMVAPIIPEGSSVEKQNG